MKLLIEADWYDPGTPKSPMRLTIGSYEGELYGRAHGGCGWIAWNLGAPERYCRVRIGKGECLTWEEAKAQAERAIRLHHERPYIRAKLDAEVQKRS